MKKYLIYFLIFLFIVIATAFISLKVASAPIYSITSKIKSVGLIEKKVEPKIPTATLLFGGDVMLSRVVGQKTVASGNWSWPFTKIASTTAASDLFIINLESPFTIGGNHLVKTGSFSFNADPQMLAGLLTAGVDVATLANNHTINQGQKGIADTQKLLTGNNIAFTGAGLNDAEARTPVIKEINGMKFGFLAYAYPDDYSIAGTATAGLAGLDVSKMQADVKKLKPQVDLVIVTMHAGIEYTNKPNQQQKTFAHAAIEAGADLVVGHHPHWVQTTEIYNGKPILYSLGNLVFDQMWSTETQEGALAEVMIENKTIKTIKVIPVIIKDYGQAEVTDATTAARILKRMGLNEAQIKIN
jgi:poly-gamma-glutamate capsule biosynthesis protein CapA/YwtB (metallophosphatase superfamily)